MKKFFLLALSLSLLQISFVLAVQPFGANYTNVSSSTATADPAQSIPAIAGNVTEINVNGFSVTQSWQGYFGNITGTIQLADSSDNVFYNWSLASPKGEIYATTDNSVDWSSISCFDLAGNHSALESAFNIESDDVDGINETFSDATSHDEFFTNNVQFTSGQCAATNIYDNTGGPTGSNFQEVLLTDSGSNTQVIFTSIIDEDVLGFDGRSHDFEMLVLEDGHGADTLTTQYYFYVELE